MTDLRDWLNGQHPGLRTYKSFREKALELCATDAEHRALYRLLANLAGHYITAFDEEPLPTDVAKHAYDVFLDLVEEGDRSIGAPVEQQLAHVERSLSVGALVAEGVEGVVRAVNDQYVTAGDDE